MSGVGSDYTNITGLAAARAALDPTRQEWRSDILISAVIEMLARRGSLTLHQVRSDLSGIWLVGAVASSVVRTTLDQCVESGLAVHEERSGGHEKWSASESAKEEAHRDRRWAESLIEQLEHDVASRLSDSSLSTVLEERYPRLTRNLLSAMIEASAGLPRAVQDAANAHRVRDLSLSLETIAARIAQEVSPPAVAAELSALVVRAADPTDRFGKEVLEIIVSGQILRGMTTYTDLPTGKPFDGTALVVDTSELVALLGADPLQVEIFRDFISASRVSGCTLIVTTDIEAEWGRLWEQADDAVARRADLSEIHSWVLESNPVVKAFRARQSEDSNVTWDSFCKRARNLRRLLKSHDAEVEYHPTAGMEKLKGYLELREALLKSERADGSRRRSPLTAGVDAASALYVRDRRTQTTSDDLPRAWFVANDPTTTHCYRELYLDDPFPLSVTVRSLLLFLTAQRPSNEEDRAGLARKLGADVVLESFLSVASSYTEDDFKNIQSALGGDLLDADDVRDAVLANFSVITNERPFPNGKVVEFLQRRTRRRDERALRETKKAHASGQRSLDAIHDADARVQVVETTNARLERRVRIMTLVAFCVALVPAVTILAFLQILAGPKLVGVVAISVGILGFEGHKYVTAEEPSGVRALIAGAATAVIAIGGSLF